MTKNKSLKNFYDSVYFKNEKKHYSNLLIMDDPLEMDNEILNVLNFKKKKKSRLQKIKVSTCWVQTRLQLRLLK